MLSTFHGCRYSHVAAMAVLFLVPWSLADAHGVPERLHACVKETDDARRLACYDRELTRAVEHPESADEPILATVTRIVERGDGTLAITLDNGQTWAQKSREYLPLKAGEQVTIRGGAFSSNRMVTESGRSTQVKRVR
ncbi:MAG: hypothetical protein ACRETT_14145 [Steroidobacteraceae bacterium]